MRKKTKHRLICEDYCAQYPDEKDLTLAKRVWVENAKIFLNTEQARNFIRQIRGHRGILARQIMSDKSLIKPLTYDTSINKRPYKEEVNTSAKVLILDIETAPIRAYVWGIWQQKIHKISMHHQSTHSA